jgi:primosomal protein N'
MDCGYIFRSPQSGAPYSLVRTQKQGAEERWFVCSTSGQRERAADTCTECGSWRLRERGIGIQHVHDELGKLLKDVPIILFDHMTASTYKKACFLRDTFYGTKGAVMLGTHMAIPYLVRPIDTAIVVNMDALLATPTWRLEEENLALLLSLREVTKGVVYIQLRGTENDLISHAKHAAVEHFYTFNYPPFTTFIHLTWQGTPEVVRKLEKDVEETLHDFALSVYPSPNPPKNVLILYGLIRVSTKDWPDKKLAAALMRLPPSVRVVINPDRIV